MVALVMTACVLAACTPKTTAQPAPTPTLIAGLPDPSPDPSPAAPPPPIFLIVMENRS